MNYPLISEYIEAIKAAEDNFAQLKHLRPVIGDDGAPIMTSGNFAVVFKMEDPQSGKFYAVKCFTKEQEGRAEAYKLIAEELAKVDSPYILSVSYLEKELFVDTKQTNEIEFPVLLMDWVEGKTLDKYLRENLDDKYALEMLAYRFSQLAQWLIPQPFAHGDLKPDNILVREDGTLVLVDYDGMYVPAMKGQKARELGSPDFRHPLRTENDFDEHIDDFPLVSILLSLKTISLQPKLLEQYGASGRLLFSEKDYRNLSDSYVMDSMKAMMQDLELATLYSLFILTSAQNNLTQASYRLLNLNRPPLPDRGNLSTKVTEEDLANAWTDEYGVKYSADKKRLLKAPATIKEYVIKSGTVVICDDAFSYFIFPDVNHHEIKIAEISSVIIPNSVTSIGERAFQDCRKMTSLFIPKSVTFIGVNAFSGCTELSRIQVEEGNGVYDSRNNCNAIVQTLDNKLILGCNKTTIPNNIVSIGQHAFFLCSVTSVTIPDSVTTIDKYAFMGCLGLKVIILPQNMKFIGESAFSLCTNLKTVFFPDRVVSVAQNAFFCCKNLHEVYTPKVFPIFQKNAFKGCPDIDFINPYSYVITSD